MRTLFSSFVLSTILLFLAGVACAQEFSAEIASYTAETKDTPRLMKIYVGKDKVRIEPEAGGEGGMGNRGGVAIIDLTTQTSDVLLPDRHMYMEMPAGQLSRQQMVTLFRPTDLENACPDWQKLARKPGGSCHKVGHEEVNGRDTVKYEATSAEGKSGFVWVDTKTRFLAKWEEKDGRNGELRNIQESSQPASLFEIPSDYQKFDMGNMMRRPAPPQ